MAHKLDVKPSPELEVYRERIEATVTPYAEIRLTNNDHPTWWQSKFGGLPYLPQGYDYPKAANGDYLYLLAQINFAEVPDLEDFPDQGILQFYLAADEDCYGLDFDNPTLQDKFRIIYFAETDLSEGSLITDFNFLPPIKKGEWLMPFEGCCKLEFEESLSEIDLNDFNFDFFDIYADEFQEICEEYYDKFCSDKHKLGGNPNFIQNDPRAKISQPDEYVLLLQISTDGNNVIHVCWGDGGIGNFFIKRSDLLNRYFSYVLYNWDCG